MPRKIACDSCHAKKIHCDRGEPQCDWCAHRGISCTYDRVPARKRQQLSSDLEGEIQKRIRRLENLLGSSLQHEFETMPDASPGRLSSHQSSTLSEETAEASQQNQFTPEGMFYGSLHFAGCDLGDISSYNDIPVFSEVGLKWIQEKTGDPNAFTTVYTSQSPDPIVSSPNSGVESQDPVTHLPPEMLVQHYFGIFTSSPLRLVFPMVNPLTFQRTIDLAFASRTRQAPREMMRARVCVLAFVAIMSLLEPERTSTPPLSADMYANRAQEYLLSVLAPATIEGLQAALMLCIYQDFSGRLQPASMLHSLACRCMFILGGHLRPKKTSSSREGLDSNEEPLQDSVSHVRMLFWLCYFFDKHISLRTGQPPSMDDGRCDLTLPEDYFGLNFRQMNLNRTSSGTQLSPVLPSDLSLTIIKSKVSTLLYSPNSLRKSDAHLLRIVRELDDELERWRLAVPSDVRPRLSVSADAPGPGTAQDVGMLVIFVHFEYLYLISTIHRACGRSQAWSEAEGGEVNALSSSLALSVQASRSTLLFLKRASKAVHRESFWLVIFYPMWATLTIFCNILHNPIAEEAGGDVELLNSIPALIKGMRARELTPNEIMHLRMLDSFVAELVRLARCAISRAVDQGDTRMVQ